MKKIHIVLPVIVAVSLVTASVAVGYWLGSDDDSSSKSDSTSKVGQAEDKDDKSTTVEEVVKTKYTNTDYGLGFDYPSEWGAASLGDGALSSPQSGGYKTVSFTEEPAVSVNIVLEPFFSPLDGCGITQPLENELYQSTRIQSSVIGWSEDTYSQYLDARQGDGTIGERDYTISQSEYKDAYQVDDVVVIARDVGEYSHGSINDDCAGNITVSESSANEANVMLGGYHLLTNFSSDTVKGINAYIDARKTGTERQETLKDELVEILNSID